MKDRILKLRNLTACPTHSTLPYQYNTVSKWRGSKGNGSEFASAIVKNF